MFLGLSRVNISPCFLTSCTVMLKHMSPLRSSYLVEFVGSVPKLKIPHVRVTMPTGRSRRERRRSGGRRRMTWWRGNAGERATRRWRQRRGGRGNVEEEAGPPAGACGCGSVVTAGCRASAWLRRPGAARTSGSAQEEPDDEVAATMMSGQVGSNI
uniref:Uncharacterized protein n=1 Tax=Oryza meridionalis TaxID=40149 RepID=A0A0E0D349_9ORYZ